MGHPGIGYYFTSNSLALGETSALDVSGVDKFLLGVAHNSDDTLIEAYAMPTLRMNTHTTGLPPQDWWVSADAHFVLAWDPIAAFPAVDFVDDTEEVLGWVDMLPDVRYFGSTVGYSVVWRPLAGPLVLKSRRKGAGGVTNPNVNGMFWHTDQHSVFDNIPGYTLTMSLNLSVRLLWQTTHV